MCCVWVRKVSETRNRPKKEYKNRTGKTSARISAHTHIQSFIYFIFISANGERVRVGVNVVMKKKRQPLVERIKEWNKGCHTRLRNCEHIERSPVLHRNSSSRQNKKKIRNEKDKRSNGTFFCYLTEYLPNTFLHGGKREKVEPFVFFSLALSLSPSLCCFIIFRFILCLDKASYFAQNSCTWDRGKRLDFISFHHQINTKEYTLYSSGTW